MLFKKKKFEKSIYNNRDKEIEVAKLIYDLNSLEYSDELREKMYQTMRSSASKVRMYDIEGKQPLKNSIFITGTNDSFEINGDIIKKQIFDYLNEYHKTTFNDLNIFVNYVMFDRFSFRGLLYIDLWVEIVREIYEKYKYVKTINLFTPVGIEGYGPVGVIGYKSIARYPNKISKNPVFFEEIVGDYVGYIMSSYLYNLITKTKENEPLFSFVHVDKVVYVDYKDNKIEVNTINDKKDEEKNDEPKEKES